MFLMFQILKTKEESWATYIITYTTTTPVQDPVPLSTMANQGSQFHQANQKFGLWQTQQYVKHHHPQHWATTRTTWATMQWVSSLEWATVAAWAAWADTSQAGPQGVSTRQWDPELCQHFGVTRSVWLRPAWQVWQAWPAWQVWQVWPAWRAWL